MQSYFRYFVSTQFQFVVEMTYLVRQILAGVGHTQRQALVVKRKQHWKMVNPSVTDLPSVHQPLEDQLLPDVVRFVVGVVLVAVEFFLDAAASRAAVSAEVHLPLGLQEVVRYVQERVSNPTVRL